MSNSRRLSLKKLDRQSHDCVFDKSPKRSGSFTGILSPRKPKTPSPRTGSDSEIGYEIRTPRAMPGSNVLKINHLEELGRGGGGSIVYKSKIGGAIYCVKELMFSDSSNEEVNQLKDEIEILRTLPKNSNLVEYSGYQLTVTKIQIIMSLYKESLFNLINRIKRKKKHLSVHQIIKISGDILNGLAILHNRRLMHRDLKSTNILYDGNINDESSLRFVLADLGEAKVIRKYEKAKTITGTPGWIAPEVLESNNDHYTFAADIWSFGMVLYEMMTLKMPYYEYRFAGNATVQGKMPKISHDQTYRYACLIPLYEGCVTRDPEKRYTIRDAFRMLNVLKENE